MSRSGAYYVVKAMERTAAGTPAAGAPRGPAPRAAVRDAPAAARSDGGRPSLVGRMLAAVRGGIDGAPGRGARGRRRVGGAAQPD
jgi:hypothetical protein